MLSPVACPTLRYFHTLFHNRHDFRGKKVTGHKTCVLIFRTNFVCSISHSKKKRVRYDQKCILVCGNKMPTRCNRGFLLQILLLAQHVSGTTMPIIRISRVLYSSCCLWYFVLCILQTGHITLSSTPDQLLEKPQHEIPQAATTV